MANIVYLLENSICKVFYFTNDLLILHDNISKSTMKNLLLLIFFITITINVLSQTWLPLGPTQTPPDSQALNGLGLVYNTIFHPTDSSTFWICGAGGAWKTNDNAATWHCLTDNMPVIGGNQIVIYPNYPDSLLLVGRGTYGNYIDGIYRSIDGGNTWDTASIIPAPAPYFYIINVIMFANNHQQLIACTNKGILKSNDGGATWSMSVSGQFTRCLQNAAHPEILYATTYFDANGNPNKFYRSLDSGNTWTESAHFNNILYGVDFAVTPANPNLIQLVTVNQQGGLDGLFKSIDGGTTFTEYRVGNCTNNILGYSTTGNSCGGQAGYDLTIAINPADENMVFIGGIFTWKSIDGGTTWALSNSNDINNGAVHVDKHGLRINPLTNALYEMNDGGINRSYDWGVTWHNISNGLNNVYIHRLAANYSAHERVLIGQQDNGNKILENNMYRNLGTGDGFCTVFDPINPNTYYISTQSGYLSKTVDGGVTWTYCIPTYNFNQPFQTNYVMDPMNHDNLYYIGDRVYLTTDAGTTWNALPNLTFSSATSERLILVNYDTTVRHIYASNYANIFHTADDGLTWNTVADTNVGGNNFKSGIAASTAFPNTLWVTLYNKTAGQKVFKTTDGGATWSNVSGSLPNVNVNCILYQANAHEKVFVGTDVGVYYRDSLMNDWSPYGAGMPIVRVFDMAISCEEQTLYAATYGRGLWKTSCICPVITGLAKMDNDLSVKVFPNPVGGSSMLLVKSSVSGRVKVVVYDVFGELVMEKVSQDGIFTINRKDFVGGMYFYRVSVGDKLTKTGKFVVE